MGFLTVRLTAFVDASPAGSWNADDVLRFLFAN
jgi:hypothetical protein